MLEPTVIWLAVVFVGLCGAALYKLNRDKKGSIESMPDEDPEVLYSVPIENLECLGDVGEAD